MSINPPVSRPSVTLVSASNVRLHLIGVGLLISLLAGCLPSSNPEVLPNVAQPSSLAKPADAQSIVTGSDSAASSETAPCQIPRDQITQISLINALMLGHYDGVTTFEELVHYGDFGLGTLNHLDGELIVLSGQGFQIHGDGTIDRVLPSAKTPFAIVTFFDRDGELILRSVDSLQSLDHEIDDAIGQRNKFLAIHARATFSSITLRSVKRQTPPYRPLSVVAKEQSVWSRNDVSGTLIGIRSPDWVQGLNVPGYHWHFLSDDISLGGHVLDCQAAEITVHYDLCDEWLVRLVDSPGLESQNLHQDLNKELRQVESSRESAAESSKSP